MLSFRTQLKLADLILTIAEGEIRTEVVRQVLAEKEFFEPYGVFKKLAHGGASITSSDILQFLKESNINATPKDAHMLLRLLDTNGDSKISYNEYVFHRGGELKHITRFLNGILPKDDIKLKEKCALKGILEVDLKERLPYDVEYGLSRIMEEEIISYRNTEKIRKDLAASSDFSCMEAFKIIDVDNMGFLDCERMNRTIAENEIRAFFRKVDIDVDKKISYPEFLEAVYTNDQDKTPVNSPAEDAYSKKLYTTPKKKLKEENYISFVRKAFSTPTRKNAPIQVSVPSSSSPEKTSETDRSNFVFKTPNRIILTKREQDKTDKNQTQIKISQPFSSDKLSPLKPKEEDELVFALKQQIKNHRELEALKNELAMRKDFNLFDMFKIFDKEAKGFINLKQYESGLNKFEINPLKDELSLIMKRLDKDFDGMIKYDFWHRIFKELNQLPKVQ